MERDGVFLFHSVHRVMKAEKALKAAGLDVRLMPVPRQLSSDCGLSLAFFLRDRETAQVALEAAGCPAEETHALVAGAYRRLP
ncbi:MAG: DUF3343 domain-containing protein [Deltaproteobacteria bacterium]|nr:DUF3343 domain-containing protein [Deltaproteobacteria bacterium]